jgi:deoxyribonuclease-1
MREKMKKNLLWLCFSVLCLFLVLVGHFNEDRKQSVSSQAKTPVEVLQRSPSESKSGNQRIESFNHAKRLLREVYADHRITFYCACPYSEEGIDFVSCGFKPFRDKKRASRIEWEHIVPASDFGRSFTAWRDGDQRCKDKRGKPFKGRNCARFVSPEFNRMEADLYNLVPAIGEVNGMRKNYPMGLLAGLPNQFGQCKTKVAQGIIEPREPIRGFIARTYKYMNSNYRGHGIISRKNEKLFDAWDKQYAPDAFEVERARRIAKIQGNTNIYIEGAAKLAQGEDSQNRRREP